jgi:hypothetical protein
LGTASVLLVSIGEEWYGAEAEQPGVNMSDVVRKYGIHLMLEKPLFETVSALHTS